jgi:DNA repair exonuclease SbcCD nuclease subunit
VAESLPLVLGGDIFDSHRPDPLSVSIFNDMLELMSTNCYYIQGNHDYCKAATWPSVTRGAKHITRKTVEISGLNVHGIDWTPRDRLPDALATVPKDVDVLVCHQAWDELQGIGNTDGSFDLVPDHIDVLLTGDYHVTKSMMFTRASGKLLHICSPGSTHMTRISEADDKFFFVVGVENGQITQKHVPIPSRRKIKLCVSNSADLASFCDADFDEFVRAPAELPAVIEKPIVHITFRDDIPGAYERLKETIGDRGHFFPAPEHVVEEVVVDVSDSPDTFDTLIGAVRRLEDDVDIADGVVRLLDATNPSEELEVMAKEYCDGSTSTSG